MTSLEPNTTTTIETPNQADNTTGNNSSDMDTSQPQNGESMAYTPQPNNADSSSPSKDPHSKKPNIWTILCAPCLFVCFPCIICAGAGMCFLVGDVGNVLDGPCCNSCVPNGVQTWAKKRIRGEEKMSQERKVKVFYCCCEYPC